VRADDLAADGSVRRGKWSPAVLDVGGISCALFKDKTKTVGLLRLALFNLLALKPEATVGKKAARVAILSASRRNRVVFEVATGLPLHVDHMRLARIGLKHIGGSLGSLAPISASHLADIVNGAHYAARGRTAAFIENFFRLKRPVSTLTPHVVRTIVNGCLGNESVAPLVPLPTMPAEEEGGGGGEGGEEGGTSLRDVLLAPFAAADAGLPEPTAEVLARLGHSGATSASGLADARAHASSGLGAADSTAPGGTGWLRAHLDIMYLQQITVNYVMSLQEGHAPMDLINLTRSALDFNETSYAVGSTCEDSTVIMYSGKQKCTVDVVGGELGSKVPMSGRLKKLEALWAADGGSTLSTLTDRLGHRGRSWDPAVEMRVVPAAFALEGLRTSSSLPMIGSVGPDGLPLLNQTIVSTQLRIGVTKRHEDALQFVFNGGLVSLFLPLRVQTALSTSLSPDDLTLTACLSPKLDTKYVPSARGELVGRVLAGSWWGQGVAVKRIYVRKEWDSLRRVLEAVPAAQVVRGEREREREREWERGADSRPHPPLWYDCFQSERVRVLLFTCAHTAAVHIHRREKRENNSAWCVRSKLKVLNLNHPTNSKLNAFIRYTLLTHT
jgi:hypothetical protein